MALFSLHVSCVRRAKGQSGVAAAAYATRSRLKDERTGKWHDFTRQPGKIIDLGSRLSLTQPVDTGELWRAAEHAEKRKNSQTARKIMVALPRELDRQTHIDLTNGLRSFLENRYGVGTTAAIHYDKPDNPHAHLVITTRSATLENGRIALGKKTRALDDLKTGPDEIETIRKQWAMLCNERLRKTDIPLIDHRSYKRRGIALTPTPHLGAKAYALELKGVRTKIGNDWRKARAARRKEYPELPDTPRRDRRILEDDFFAFMRPDTAREYPPIPIAEAAEFEDPFQQWLEVLSWIEESDFDEYCEEEGEYPQEEEETDYGPAPC